MKVTRLLILTGIIGLIYGCGSPVAEVQIVPEPASMEIHTGSYRVATGAPLYVNSKDAGLKQAAVYLAERFKKSSFYAPEIQVSEQPAGKGIFLALQKLDFSTNPEAYRLEVTGDGVTISGNTPRGVFYGVQTLLQLFQPAIYGDEQVLKKKDLKIRQLMIQDEPAFKWRGMHLDVGRHLFPVSFIKKYIDLIAMHKMNVFHWHLTEDQGWRIEIKKYPKLTGIGSVRIYPDGTKYGGFYTQEEVKEVVAYANSHFVDVMPEIEMPGHSVAALAAYPELSCTGGPFKVRTAWGVSRDVYCAGKEETFHFLEDVLSEVVDLFPFQYLHIGGDECPKVRWKACPDCQRRIREEGLKDERELQSYFIRRIEKFLETKNRRLVGWDEILEGGLPPAATVMSWRGIKGGIAAAQQGHDVIMSPTGYCYFDYYQGDRRYEPKAIGGFLPLEKVYSYDPVPANLTPQEAKHILGAQGNVWTEYIPDQAKVEYMALPRMCALAEVVWTPKPLRDYEQFTLRMDAQYARLDAMKVNYRVPPPVVVNRDLSAGDSLNLILKNPLDITTIRYTTDGTDPVVSSDIFPDSLMTEKQTTVKAATFMPGGHSSKIIELHIGIKN